MAYYQPRNRYAIQSLRETVTGETPNPDWPNAVRMFQSLLETVGTPESVEQTLEFIKQLKAQALLHHVRDLENAKITKQDAINRIELDISQLLVKEMNPGDPQTTNVFVQNDISLADRFGQFIKDIGETEDENVVLTEIHKISLEMPYDEFQTTFCKFLEKINNSLMNPPIELMAEGTPLADIIMFLESVKLRATDLVTVISKEDLQAIHKGNDPILMDFLEHHNMLGIVEQKPLFTEPVADLSIPQTADLGDGSSFEYDVLTGLTHESADGNIMKSSKHSKRKRPHEDSVGIGPAKRRPMRSSQSEEWNSDNFEDAEIIDELAPKQFIPMKEIARSVRKNSTGPVQDIQLPTPDRPSPRTPQRATGTTITGQRKRKRWTDEEVDFLLEGVRLFGVGSWKDILNHFQFGDRTYVDLKDKFRNLRKHYSLEELLGSSGQENTV